MTICEPQIFGADPVNVRWSVVRGDTAVLRVMFLEADETTPLDLTGWIFESTAFNRRQEIFNELDVEVGSGYVDIIATSDVTASWGTGIGGRVVELIFDLQVEIGTRVWTPVLGTVSVLGDVTGGAL